MVWLTYGAFNILVDAQRAADRDRIHKWCRGNDVPVEVWTVRNGNVLSPELPSARPKHQEWRDRIASLSAASAREEIRESVKEYCSLISATMARTEQVAPDLLASLAEGHHFVHETVHELSATHPDTTDITADRGLLVKINAGLSRFSSQAYSGTSPIAQTECHYWNHSLLGSYVANRVLHNIYTFTRKWIGEARIPQQLESLKDRTSNIPDLARIADIDRDFWVTDHLAGVAIEHDQAEDPIVPVFTYFSGRDGFASSECTLSAPLYTISSCNSFYWTMMILTHELSHVFVRGVLSVLYPETPDEILHALTLVDPNYQPTNWLESVKRFLLQSVVAMQQANETSNGQHPKTQFNTPDDLVEVLNTWRYEVEEILVDAFDFLYFYGSDAKTYIRNIWLSWGLIPNIGGRVPEYVVRTLCAVMSKHLRRGEKTEDLTRRQTVNTLKGLRKTYHKTNYLDEAVQHISEDWDDRLLNALIARKPLVQIVRAFLFRKDIAKAVLKETHLSGGGDPDLEGYTMEPLHFDNSRFSNPLAFLKAYTNHSRPCTAHSYWLLSKLAFDIDDAN